MAFHEKLQALRKEQGLSQEALAEQLGVTRQAVSKWEAGAAYPETEKILTLCKLYGLSADQLLLDGEGAETHRQQPKPARRWLIPVLCIALALALAAGGLSYTAFQKQQAEAHRLSTLQADLEDQLEAGARTQDDLRQQLSELEAALQQAESASPSAVPADGRSAAKALTQFFMEFGRRWRLDYVPEFTWQNAPDESADYLMWAFTVNADGWSEENNGTMSKDYVADAVLSHFAVPDLSHTSLWKTWIFDGEYYTAIPQGYNGPSIYLFQSFSVHEVNGAAVWSVELLQCDPAWEKWGNATWEEIFEKLYQEPPLGQPGPLLNVVCREWFSFSEGFHGPVFLEHTSEYLGK